MVRQLRGVPWPCPERESAVISTGLSVTMRGHLITVKRDEQRKVATVMVSALPNYVPTGMEFPEVREAAEMLAARAQRFLGIKWRVNKWEPKRDLTKMGGESAH